MRGGENLFGGCAISIGERFEKADKRPFSNKSSKRDRPRLTKVPKKPPSPSIHFFASYQEKRYPLLVFPEVEGRLPHRFLGFKRE